MNDLQIFNFNNSEVRTVLIDGEPYFVGKDVATILGYKDTVNALKQHVDDEDKKMGCPDTTPYIMDSIGRKQYPIYINESGVYSLVFGSKLPEAKKFKRWVTSEVLPQIRQTGCYKLPQSYKEALQHLLTQIEENEHLQLENKMKDQQIAELKPKADYCDDILKNQGLTTTTSIAKDYGMSATEFNRLLHNFGVQFKQSGQWFLYRKYQDKGYTSSETVDITRSDSRKDVKMNTKWTQKGRLFLYNLLKEHNIVPMIEKVGVHHGK